MRAVTLFEEPYDEHPSHLESGDVIFVPLVGKRLVADRRGSALFLDYPKKPRVIGSPATRETSGLVAPDEGTCLGWVSPTRQCMVVGHSEDIEKESEVDGDPIAEALGDELELRALLNDLLAVTNELDAIARREGGQAIDAHLRDTKRRLRSIGAAAADLPKGPRTDEFQQLMQQVRRSADQLTEDVRIGPTSDELRHIIGAVQKYDDDF